MLSLIPPSTDMYERLPPSSSSTCLTVPTSYSVMPAGPMMARPGSKASTGIAMPVLAHSFATMSPMSAAMTGMSSGSSSDV
jgi:hypothetical protein